MAKSGGNLFDGLPTTAAGEVVSELLSSPHVRIERIVSTGQSSPAGFWYDQDCREWVVVLSGQAGLRFEGESETRHLRPGDYLDIPAHCRHRIEWTDTGRPTVWLAVHVLQSG